MLIKKEMNPLSDGKIIDSWLKNAKPWIASVQNSEIESRQLVTNQAIIDAVRSRNPETGIDIGCGEGWLIRELSGIRMSGIDVVPELVETGRQAGIGEFKVMSYEDIARGQLGIMADVAICNFSLLGQESVEGVFNAARTFLKPGGALIVQTLHPAMACGEQEYKDGWRAGTWNGFSPDYQDPPPWYFRTIESWINLYVRAGLQLCEVREPLHPKSGKPASIIFIGETAI
jgi:2-polyprenyl-3-methyl-5-hydroxy-6-metoxy-1,4-benzoquinol methylase